MLDPVTTYKRAQTEGLSQRDLIVMCYKGAANFLEQARQAHAAEDFDTFAELLEKAHRVIVHLYTTLDTERGGEIAAKLGELYAYMISQLYLISATKDVAAVESIIQILNTVKTGWEELDPGSVSTATEPPTKREPLEHKQLVVQG
jgi:flagellar protein FliS